MHVRSIFCSLQQSAWGALTCGLHTVRRASNAGVQATLGVGSIKF